MQNLKKHSELIRFRIMNFWGYGNLKGDVWFVGMEEGCDGNISKLIKRFEATSQGEIFDIYEDMRGDAEHMKWFKEDAPTQSTYRKLIYLLLYLNNKKEPALEDIRDYQIEHFGRKKNNHAVLELMPLPARSIKAEDWIYKTSDVEGLSSRKEYLEHYLPERLKRLRELIYKNKPKIVVFYSMQYKDNWFSIVDKPFKEMIKDNLYLAKDSTTAYAIVPHSVAKRRSNKDWKKIAEKIISQI